MSKRADADPEVRRWTWTPAALLAIWAAGAAAQESAQALVIGNSHYANLAPVPACEGAAHAVAAAFRGVGFDVTERADLSNGEMAAALRHLAAGQPGSRVAYVCGYVTSDGARVFLLPASARLGRDGDLTTQGIAARALLRVAPDPDAVPSLVLIDGIPLPGEAADAGLEALAAAVTGAQQGFAAMLQPPGPGGTTAFASVLADSVPGPPLPQDVLLAALGAKLPPGVLAVHMPARPAALLAAPPLANPQASAPQASAPQASALLANPPTPAPLANPPTPPVLGSIPQDGEATPAGRRHVQAALGQLGYYGGRIDGVLGADSRAAIRRYQHEIGADTTGTLTPEQAGRLFAVR